MRVPTVSPSAIEKLAREEEPPELHGASPCCPIGERSMVTKCQANVPEWRGAGSADPLPGPMGGYVPRRR